MHQVVIYTLVAKTKSFYKYEPEKLSGFVGAIYVPIETLNGDKPTDVLKVTMEDR